ncbi:MAG: tetratricopeptide repeat protein [Pontiellaceae bacterium]|nr:tetratricopeptide repeat protein [Pontiellaceae bacterium]MBN2784728.1 tetratricopeptide repeat protein [Pontiellaceae bacterium]
MKHNYVKYTFGLGLCASWLLTGASYAEELQDVLYAVTDMSDVGSADEKSERNADAPEVMAIWDSEKFQKDFLGSYGMNADIEPQVSVVEREQMQKVMNVMSDEDDIEKAMKLLTKNCGESTSPIFEFTLANLYFQQDKLEDAMKWYDEAISQFGTFRRAYKNAGLIHVRNGDFDKAIPYLTKTVELGGNSSMTYGLLAFAYAQTENNLCAESAYRLAILLDPETMDWQLGLAQSLFKQQKYGDAVSLCRTLIKKYPDNADFWMLQANAYLGLKQPMRAAENYEYVNVLGKATSDSMTMLGDIYVNESRWDMAADAYLRAFELDDGAHPEKPLRAAKILSSRGALNEARRVLVRVAERKAALGEESLKELLKLQARVAVADGGGEDVVKILEEVVQVDPLDGEAYMLLAKHYGRNKPEKAIFYYERAEAIEEFEAEAKLYHGQLLVAEAKYQDALPLLRRAYELKPREDIQDYLKQVERIAKTRG